MGSGPHMTSKTPSTESQDTAPEGLWEQLVEAVATGQLPVFEVMRSTAPQLYKEGHHEGFVMFTRAFHMLMSDPRYIGIRAAAITAPVSHQKRSQRDATNTIERGES